eukprot:scaffold4575_cov55-Phaeocystis_antarctica.AAC.3
MKRSWRGIERVAGLSRCHTHRVERQDDAHGPENARDVETFGELGRAHAGGEAARGGGVAVGRYSNKLAASSEYDETT